MLLVKTKLAPSKIDGLGLFADQFISKGTVVWQFKEGFDVEITEDQFGKLPAHVQEFVKSCCYLDHDTKYYVMCLDNARFMNHSDQPNLGSDFSTDRHGLTVANSDIESGTELTENYHVIDGLAGWKLRAIES